MTFIPLTPEEKALQAALRGQGERFVEALDEALSQNLSLQDMHTNHLIVDRTTKYNIIEAAVVQAAKTDSCEVLIEIERRGVNLKDVISKVINPETFMEGNKEVKFLDFILARWPEKFDEKYKKNLLHVAAELRQFTKVDFLIQRGWEVDGRDQKGRTPLMMAKGATSVGLLLWYGADLHAKDNNNKTPTWHAVQYVIKKAKKEGPNLYSLKEEDAWALNKLVAKNGLMDDPQKFLLARKMARLAIDNHLVAGFDPAKEAPCFKIIYEHICKIQAMDRHKKLGALLRRPRRSQPSKPARM